MASTTHPEFDGKTEGVDVTKAFDEQVRGKTVIVTGVNRSGIGFATAQALVSATLLSRSAAGINRYTGLPVPCQFDNFWP